MKYWKLSLLLLLLIPQLALAESISLFDAKVSVDPQFIAVTETISYDLGSAEHHGIYRDIPVTYRTNDNNRSIDLTVSTVTRDGQSEPYQLQRNGNNLRIKIGDANRTISGSHTYRIDYRVAGAINFFADFDELYWNATGNDWPVGISQVTVHVSLPDGITLKQMSCYQGPAGSQTACLISKNDDAITFTSAGALQPGDGLTFAMGINKGFFIEPTLWDKSKRLIQDNWILLLPLLAFFILFSWWRRHGKDPLGRGTIIPEYEPPRGVNPTMVGSLVDEKIDNSDITAGIIYLAQQGYIHINRLEKNGFFSSADYELTVKKDLPAATQGIEGSIGDILFPSDKNTGNRIKLTELKKDRTLIKRIKQLKKDISEEMMKQGWYEKNPTTVRATYMSIGGLLAFIGFFIGNIQVTYLIALLITAVMVIIFGYNMPKKTTLGAEVKEHILGFKEFLSVTDKERFKFHDAPEKNPQQFMQYLPFAVAMGVEKQWADQFKDIYIEPPEWYQGNYTHAIIATQLANDLSGFSSNLQSNLSSAASGGAGSGGGGFSGGGFGGGGGGSW